MNTTCFPDALVADLLQFFSDASQLDVEFIRAIKDLNVCNLFGIELVVRISFIGLAQSMMCLI